MPATTAAPDSATTAATTTTTAEKPDVIIDPNVGNPVTTAAATTTEGATDPPTVPASAATVTAAVAVTEPPTEASSADTTPGTEPGTAAPTTAPSQSISVSVGSRAPAPVKNLVEVCLEGSEFACDAANGLRNCIEATKRCDGAKDCGDGADEEGCTGFKAPGGAEPEPVLPATIAPTSGAEEINKNAMAGGDDDDDDDDLGLWWLLIIALILLCLVGLAFVASKQRPAEPKPEPEPFVPFGQDNPMYSGVSGDRSHPNPSYGSAGANDVSGEGLYADVGGAAPSHGGALNNAVYSGVGPGGNGAAGTRGGALNNGIYSGIDGSRGGALNNDVYSAVGPGGGARGALNNAIYSGVGPGGAAGPGNAPADSELYAYAQDAPVAAARGANANATYQAVGPSPFVRDGTQWELNTGGIRRGSSEQSIEVLNPGIYPTPAPRGRAGVQPLVMMDPRRMSGASAVDPLSSSTNSFREPMQLHDPTSPTGNMTFSDV